MNSIKTKSRKVTKGAIFALKWITPYGLLKSVWNSEERNRREILESSNERLIKSRAYIGLLVSLSVFIGCTWVAFNSISDSGSFGITAVVASAIGVFSILKFFSYLSIAKGKISEVEIIEDNKNDDHKKGNEFKIDHRVASILLFRITVFKYTYAMAACFSALLLLSPYNVNGLEIIIKNGTLTASSAVISILTAVGLTIILCIKSLTSKIDTAIMIKNGASTNLNGYRTVNNNCYQLISMMVIIISVAMIGDIILEAIGKRLPIHLAGTLPVIVALYLCAFSLVAFRSGVSISGFITDDKSKVINPIQLIYLRKIDLPSANENNHIMQLPNVNIVIALSFSFCVLAASMGGIISLIVLIPVTIMQGILLAINEFHLKVKEQDYEYSRE